LEGASPVAGLGEHMSSKTPSIHCTSMTTTQPLRTFSLVKYPEMLLQNIAINFRFDSDEVEAVAVMTVRDSMIATHCLARRLCHLPTVLTVLALALTRVFQCIVDDLHHVGDCFAGRATGDDVRLALLAPGPATRGCGRNFASSSQVGTSGDDEFEASLCEWSKYEGMDMN